MDETIADSARQKSSWGFWWLIAGAVVGVLLVMNPLGMSGGDARKHEGVGQRLPPWQLKPLTGDAQPVSSDELSGQVVLLNFWGTWCPPCRQEFPHIVEMAQQFAGNPDFRLLAVSCGSDFTDHDTDLLRAETREFLARQKAELPTYADPEAFTRQHLMMVASMRGYPFTVVLDRQGVIRGVWEGYRAGSENEMQQLIEQLLKPEAAAR